MRSRIAANIRRGSLRLAASVILIAGLSLVISDGPLFPWPNVGGLGGLVIFAICVNRRTYGR
jgi:hypothetical protein